MIRRSRSGGIRFGEHRASAAAVIAIFVLFSSSPAPAQQTFEDVTAKLGFEGMRQYQVSWSDYDNDGWVDLFDGAVLWRNAQGKKFVKVEGVPPGGDPATWGDFDNDGFLDIYYTGNGRLLRNNGGKEFTNASSMLPKRPMRVSRGAAWGDFDGDGFLDLYVSGYEIWGKISGFPDVVFRNEKGRKFKEVWRSADAQAGRGVTAADFDEDGDLDVYVSNYRLQPNNLLLNDGKGGFSDVAAAYGVAGDGGQGAWGHTVGSCWGDLDNDGHLDLFVGNFSHRADYQDRPKFYRNMGKSGKYHFEDKSEGAGLRWQESYVSPALGDYDNDGDLDLFFATFYGGDKSVLYSNNGNWTFTEVTAESGIDSATTYGAAWADYDNDGDLDLLTAGKLYRNRGNKNHWLKVRLQGTGGVNRSAIGAKVRLALGGKVLTRQVESSTGEGNQNDPTLHFGLGDHGGAVKLLITWPDGKKQTVTTRVDRLVKITMPRSPGLPKTK